MGVPRGLMPSATFEDTFTSVASCRRPTRGLQDPQNEHGLSPRLYPPHHTQATPTPSWGPEDVRVLVPRHLRCPLPHLRQWRRACELYGSLRINSKVGSSRGR